MIQQTIGRGTYPPIIHVCSFCEKILSDSGDWMRFSDYIRQHPYADVSHGICPGCLKEFFPNEYMAICADQNDGNDLSATLKN